MLFSDMEGSTRLLIQLGDAYADVLRAQRSIQREAYLRWHGREMGTEGDSFFVVFRSAGDAVNACLTAQRLLAAHEWPGGHPVRVRMGVHSGAPTPHEDGYVGIDVHVAARVAATAHGGQIVVSDATCRLVSGQLPTDAQLRSLGAHRLKDIEHPQVLHQLVAPGLDVDFPPLRSLGTRTNLPRPFGELVGRDDELAHAVGMLARPDLRLLTLTGPGGAGKTRLALAVAEAVAAGYADGVYFVRLASVTDLDVMWTTIAEAMGLAGDSRAPRQSLEQIAQQRVLLVLDNLEQLPAAGSVVAELMSAVPRLDVLATSRRPVHVDGEQEYAVQPLSEEGAVEMFRQRTRLVRPDFAITDDNRAAVSEICRQLDGLPLAVELATARAKLLTPQALLARLDALELPARRGVDDRQRTLRSTMVWSYDLLDEATQRGFRRLGVFAGSADLDAVARVTGDPDPLPLATELLDASLVRVDDGPLGAPRIRLLQTVRRFALEVLADAGELADVRRTHAEHYVALAESANNELRGPHELAARATIESALPELREVLVWCLEEASADDDARLTLGMRLCSALSWFWYTSGYVAEGRHWTQRATARASSEQGGEFATVLHTLAVLLMQQGDYQQGRNVAAKCLRIWRRIGDQSMIAKELNSLGVAYMQLGDHDRARGLMQESLAIAREIHDKARQAAVLTNLGILELDGRRPGPAIDLFVEAEAIDRERGDEWGVMADHVNRVGAHIEAGQVDQASDLLVSVADQALAFGDTDIIASVIELFAVCFGLSGDPARSAQLSGTAAALREEADLPLSGRDAEFYERHLKPGRAAVSDARWETDAAEGRHLTAAQALERTRPRLSH